MTARLVALLVANGLMLELGAGLLVLMGLARTPRAVLAKLPLAYALGLAATGVLASALGVAHVPVGWVGLFVLAAASLGLGIRRLELAGGPRRAWRASDAAPLAVLAVTGAFLLEAARLLAVKPLLELDGWAIWATRARALYDFGHPVAPVFTSADYAGVSYPLWLPALEAVDFRFMGAFDGTLVHLQLAGLAIGFVGGAWVLLREHVPLVLLAATLLAIVTAPSFFGQLQTNFADVPLAMLVALGVVSLAVWLRTDEGGLLAAAALFLGAGATTKNEGELFALAAIVAAAAVARRSQRRPLALAALVVLAIDLPWRAWAALNHVRHRDYALSNLFDPSYLAGHRDRVGPIVRELAAQLWRRQTWSFVVVLVVLGLAGALLLRNVRPALFAATWLALSFAGLVAIYWVSRNPVTNHLFNSSDRTIDTLVLGGALLVPLLLSVESSAPEIEPGAAEA